MSLNFHKALVSFVVYTLLLKRLITNSNSHLKKTLQDLNKTYRENPSLWEADFVQAGFEWVDVSDVKQSVLSYIRWDRNRKNPVLTVMNCTPVVRYDYRIGVPLRGQMA